MKFFTEVVHLDCTSGEIFLFLPTVLTKIDSLGTV